ncbi:MAG: hypothetical protein ACHQPI_09185 [Thermoanaerobaculia bacterium]
MTTIRFLAVLDRCLRSSARLGIVRTLLLAAAVPLVLRLLLLPVFPLPLPEVHDEFSYLLLADTFAHGRLVNPAPALPEFFESFHILVTPVYASMYPVGQGLVLAAGQVLLGQAWWGVFGAVGLMCAAVAWLLRAFMPRRWAVVGSIAFGLIYGVEHYFMNSYWGAPLATAAGAVMAGALARIVLPREGPGHPVLYGFLVGAGAGVLLHTRPWEGFCAALPVALVFLWWLVRSGWKTFGQRLGRVAFPAVLTVSVAGAALLAYDARVTGNPLEPPYLLNLNRYYIAPLFVFQSEKPAPSYNNEVMRRFYVGWRESERSIRQDVDAKSPLYGFWLWFRAFKIVGGAVLSLLLLLALRRDSRTLLLSVLLGGFLAGLSFQSVRLFHYLAPGLGLLAVSVVLGLRALSTFRIRGRRIGRHLAAVLVLAAAVGLVRNTVLTLRPGERGYGIRRADLIAHLSAEEGRHLVFVEYGPRHVVHQEWVYNGADLEGARILFARSISREANEHLLARYPGRRAWLLRPDEADRLIPYPRP